MRRLSKFVIPALILTVLPAPAAFAGTPQRGWRDRVEDRWDRREDRRDRARIGAIFARIDVTRCETADDAIASKIASIGGRTVATARRPSRPPRRPPRSSSLTSFTRPLLGRRRPGPVLWTRLLWTRLLRTRLLRTPTFLASPASAAVSQNSSTVLVTLSSHSSVSLAADAEVRQEIGPWHSRKIDLEPAPVGPCCHRRR